MKLKNAIKILFFLIQTLHHIPACSNPYLPECYGKIPPKSKKHIIGYWGYNSSSGQWMSAGFFAAVMGALNNIAWTANHGKQAYVVWGPESPYYEADKCPDHNAWTCFFEQVSNASFDPITDAAAIHRHYWDPSNEALFVPGMLPNKTKGARLIKEFLKIKPHILTKINTFYEQNFTTKKTAAIHLRGTDKSVETNLPNPRTILAAANAWAAQQTQPVQFFIATDEAALLALAHEILEYPIISYPSHRSSNTTPIHSKADEYSPYLKGEEVLIETVLLSRCAAFFHAESNIAYMAVQFNPKIEDHLIKAERYVIGMPHFITPDDTHITVDFFPALFSTLSHCMFSKEAGINPIVYWPDQTNTNLWETLFSPTSPESYQRGDTINTQFAQRSPSTNELLAIEQTALSPTYRATINQFIKEYLHLTPDLQEEIDLFHAQNFLFDDPDVVTVGVHLEGLNTRALHVIDTYQKLSDHALNLAKHLESQGKKCQFFIVTNEESLFLFNARPTLKDYPIIHRPKTCGGYLSSGYVYYNNYLFGNNENPSRTFWQNMLIDAYLLAQCDHIIHTHSSMSYFVRFLNPQIIPHCITVFGTQDPYCYQNDLLK